MKILKIHGCSGAGKTTAVRLFMKSRGTVMQPLGGLARPEAYLDPEGPTYVLGAYENACGGVDTVGSSQEVMELLERYAPRGNVIFEGLLQSTYYGLLGQHSRQYGDRYVYAFMDTPVELCLERVVARRAKSGRGNKFNPQLTRDKHATIEQLKRKLETGAVGFKHRVVTLKHDEDLVAQIEGLLR